MESESDEDFAYNPKSGTKKVCKKKKTKRTPPSPSPPPRREARVSSSKTAYRARMYSRKRRAQVKMDELRKQTYVYHLGAENTCMKTVEIPKLKKQVEELLNRVYLHADPVALAQILYPVTYDSSSFDEIEVLDIENHDCETEVS